MICPRRLLERVSRREDPTDSLLLSFPPFPCLSDSRRLRVIPFPAFPSFPPFPPFPSFPAFPELPPRIPERSPDSASFPPF